MALLLAALAAIAPGTAAAKGAHSFTFPASGPTFKADFGHGGYRFELEAEEAGSVTLVVSQPGDEHTRNGYVTKARVSGEGIKADLGPLGKIDLAFRPLGKPSSEKFPLPGCHGKPTLDQRGVFVGTFRFRGENGYTAFRAGRLKGSSVTSFRQRCRAAAETGESGAEERSEVTELSASSASGDLSFGAYGSDEPGSSSLFFAASIRHLRKVIEIRTATSIGSRKAFEFDEGLTKATVSPGKPFEGSAAFEKGPTGVTTWSGDLRADFLGGTQPLVGGRIEAELRHPRPGEGGAVVTVTNAGGSASRVSRLLATLNRSPVPTDR